ncbi:MAG: hypothetical protein N2445_08025, partial [Acidobacteria bacterium]|nr:hypothetical protein [Acidobacteriota bacterium]
IALKRIEPSALVVIETEIWPSLFYLCKIKDIPVFIVNARISEIKINKYIRYKRLFADTINKIWILCSSEEYKDRYMKVGADSGRIIITGNMKFDITFPEESKISKFKISVRDFLKEEFKIWVAGSVREGEEEKILRCHKKISQHIEKSKLIIAPRHLNRVGKIIEMCNIIGLKPALRSEFPTKDWDVLILDTYGELFYAYSLSRIAFVGGSLVELGGQNPLEPLLHKNAVIIGSHFSNFKEEVNVLREYKGIIIVNSEEELAEKIIYLFKNDEYRDIIAEKGFQVIDKCKGASERTASFIKEKICYQDQIPASNNEEGITNG